MHSVDLFENKLFKLDLSNVNWNYLIRNAIVEEEIITPEKNMDGIVYKTDKMIGKSVSGRPLL